MRVLMLTAFALVVAILSVSVVMDVFNSAAGAFEEHLAIERSTMD